MKIEHLAQRSCAIAPQVFKTIVEAMRAFLASVPAEVSSDEQLALSLSSVRLSAEVAAKEAREENAAMTQYQMADNAQRNEVLNNNFGIIAGGVSQLLQLQGLPSLQGLQPMPPLPDKPLALLGSAPLPGLGAQRLALPGASGCAAAAAAAAADSTPLLLLEGATSSHGGAASKSVNPNVAGSSASAAANAAGASAAASVVMLGGKPFMMVPMTSADPEMLFGAALASQPTQQRLQTGSSGAAAAAAAAAALAMPTLQDATHSYVPSTCAALDSFSAPVLALWNEWTMGVRNAHPLRSLVGRDRSPEQERVRADWARKIQGNSGFGVKCLKSQYDPVKQVNF